MRPIAKYFGSRWRLAKLYGAPTRKRVIEPFAGMAGYSLYWENEDVVLVEKYEVVANIWKWLIHDATPADINAVPDDAHNRDMVPGPDPLKDLVGFWFIKGDARPRRKMTPHCFEKRAGGDGQFWDANSKKRIIDALSLVRRWKIIHGSYECVDDPDAFYFVDPPFQHEGTIYPHNGRQLDFHALGEWCKSRPAGVVCETTRADWLPFRPLKTTANQAGKIYTEAVFHIEDDWLPWGLETDDID